jgi:hypothetical protein
MKSEKKQKISISTKQSLFLALGSWFQLSVVCCQIGVG